MAHITEKLMGIVSLASGTGRSEFINVVRNLSPQSLSYAFSNVNLIYVGAKMSPGTPGLMFHPLSNLREMKES